jgi:hypothetical protein
VIEPGDWWVENSRKYGGKAMPVGFEVHWRVVPLCADRYQTPAAVALDRETTVTLAQGIENGPHLLRLVSLDGKPVPPAAIRVYRPRLAI